MKLQLSALFLCGLLAGCQTATGNPPAASSPLSDAELFAKAKPALLAILRDPDSAKFSDMKRAPSEWGDYVCGRVNAKNGLGGYAGAHKFSVNPNGEAAVGGESISQMMSPCWSAIATTPQEWESAILGTGSRDYSSNPNTKITQ